MTFIINKNLKKFIIAKEYIVDIKIFLMVIIMKNLIIHLYLFLKIDFKLKI